MPHNAPVQDRVAALNARYKHHGATAVLTHALRDAQVGRTALVSSFGAESVVLLHLVSIIDRTTPVIFIDTEMLFDETSQYQKDVAQKLDLTDIRVITPKRDAILKNDVDGLLHQADTDACCHLRKVKPLEDALADFGGWIPGRQRFQSGTRADIPHFEKDARKIKINPLAHWAPEDVRAYMIENRLPRHPLADWAS